MSELLKIAKTYEHSSQPISAMGQKKYSQKELLMHEVMARASIKRRKQILSRMKLD